jgi:sugar phosphate permease
MGGNVGDAIAPIVVGAALWVFTWREVVVMNVLPGLVVALLMLVFLGSDAPRRKEIAAHESQTLAQYWSGCGSFSAIAR